MKKLTPKTIDQKGFIPLLLVLLVILILGIIFVYLRVSKAS